MITMRIKGGLGNQLFQYAAGYALAKRLKTSMNLDVSFFSKQTLRGYKLNKMNVTYKSIADSSQMPRMVKISKNRVINKLMRMTDWRVITAGQNWKILMETRPEIIEQYFSISGNKLFVDGYFQSPQYFGRYRDELLHQFVPNYKPEEEYLRTLKNIHDVNSVAVHVRRGDLLKAQFDRNPRHYMLNESYYRKAINRMDEMVETPIYFWFSDDIQWVKSNLGLKENYRFVSLHTKHSDIDEMMLMSKCKNFITANSTFSWWAAWLNQNRTAKILCPEQPYGISGMIPQGWEKIKMG